MLSARTTANCLLSAALVSAAALSAGCIRSESKLTLNADGTAAFEISYSMAEQTINQIKAVRKLRDDLNQAGDAAQQPSWQDAFIDVFADPVEERIREEIAKYEPYGIAAEKVEVQSRNNWRYMLIKIRCSDLAAMGKTHLFREYGFSLERKDDGTYLMTRVQQCPPPPAKPDYDDPETARLLGSILSGYSIRISVQAPGRIVGGNATRVSLYSADWDFDFNRDHDAMTKFQNHELKLQFQGKGLELPLVKQD
jgi:hypothetical protein